MSFESVHPWNEDALIAQKNAHTVVDEKPEATRKGLRELVDLGRFEPLTPWFQSECSQDEHIQAALHKVTGLFRHGTLVWVGGIPINHASRLSR